MWKDWKSVTTRTIRYLKYAPTYVNGCHDLEEICIESKFIGINQLGREMDHYVEEPPIIASVHKNHSNDPL
jgi:hypothetical protein